MNINLDELSTCALCIHLLVRASTFAFALYHAFLYTREEKDRQDPGCHFTFQTFADFFTKIYQVYTEPPHNLSIALLWTLSRNVIKL